jgi:hypothetical protein
LEGDFYFCRRSFYCQLIKEIIYFPEIKKKGNLLMNLAPKRTLTAVIVCCVFLLPNFVLGQDAGNVLINTNPQGSLIRLEGEITLSGVSPVKFDRPLTGQYRIEVVRDGYEKYNSVTYFSEAQSTQLDIELVPKTRAKAFIRSLLIPGWGQKYYGNQTKSAIYFTGTLASLVGYFFVKDDFDSKEEDYLDRKEAYENATVWSDLPLLDRELREAQEEANDAEDKVNFMAAVTGGFYLLSLLDSFLFFPEFDKYTEYKAITARPEVEADRVGIILSVNF